MTGHGDELLAQAGVFPLMAQRRLGDLVAAFIGELEHDQLGKDLEHAQGARIRNLGRIRIDRAEITERAAVGKNIGTEI